MAKGEKVIKEGVVAKLYKCQWDGGGCYIVASGGTAGLRHSLDPEGKKRALEEFNQHEAKAKKDRQFRMDFR